MTNKQKGLGLIEILIGVLVSSLILLTLLSFLISSKRQYKETALLMNNRYETLWVKQLISDSVKRAGFLPCVKLSQLESYDSRSDQSDSLTGLKFSNDTYSWLQTNRMSNEYDQVLQVSSPVQIRSSSRYKLSPDNPIIIADCEHAEIHEVLSITKDNGEQEIILKQPLIYTFKPPIYLGEWIEEKWMIRQNKKGESSLFYSNGQSEELAPSIVNLQLTKLVQANKTVMEIKLEQQQEKEYLFAVWARNL